MDAEIKFEMERVDCPTCGIITYYPKNFIKIKRENGGKFHCPNQHEMHYTTDTTESLKARLDAAEAEVQKLRTENIRLISKLEQMEGSIIENEEN